MLLSQPDPETDKILDTEERSQSSAIRVKRAKSFPLLSRSKSETQPDANVKSTVSSTKRGRSGDTPELKASKKLHSADDDPYALNNLFDCPEVLTQVTDTPTCSTQKDASSNLVLSSQTPVLHKQPDDNNAATFPVNNTRPDNSRPRDEERCREYQDDGIPFENITTFSEVDVNGSVHDDDELSSFLADRPVRRSLLSELLQCSEPGHAEDEDVFMDPEARRSILEAVFGEDVQPLDDNGDGEETMMSKSPPTRSSRLQQQYNDAIDEFFSSSHIEDNIPTERIMSSSLKKSQLQPWNWHKNRPGYLTLKPRFLDEDYFATHGPTTCSGDDESEEENKENEEEVGGERSPFSATPYFDIRFSILSLLGSGEYAEVYKVKDLQTGQLAALKKTKVPFCSYDDR